MSRSVLGIEVGARLVRAVVLTADHRVLIGAAEARFPNEIEQDFDPSATWEAVREVLYQLGHLVPKSMPAAVSIGPANGGVGSGPSLPTWLEGRARFLGEDLVCSGELGLAFSPSGPISQVVDCCASHDVQLKRIDLAPMAAQRLLPRSAGGTFTLGSGVGWQAGVRSNVVLAATQSDSVSTDARLMASSNASDALRPPSFDGFPISNRLQQQFELELGQLAPAIGAAVGVIVSAPANLLDGFKVVGRPLAGAQAFRQSVAGRADDRSDTASDDAVGGDEVDAEAAGDAGREQDAQMFDPNLRDIMPFPVTEPMRETAETTVKPAVERLGGHGIAGKSSEIDAMVGSGQRIFSVMTVIVVILVVAVAAVMSLR